MYQKILVPLDGSGPSMLALVEAIKLSKSYGSQLRLIHVVNELVLMAAAETHPSDRGGVVDAIRAEGKAVLAKAEGVVREHAIEPQSLLIESIGDRAADRIVEQAKQWQADLIVMGTHGRHGLRRLAFGSDAELVVRSAPVPVLVVRGDAT